MSDRSSPVIVWFRRDLRLSDHAALTEASRMGRPVIPVFLCDETVQSMGAAPRWRLGLGVAELARTLEKRGTRLILRRGRALDCLRALIDETGADAVFWTRCYDPAAIARDTLVKSALSAADIQAQSFSGHVLFEPWDVSKADGGYYKVYSPFWRAIRGIDVPQLFPEPARVPAPDAWPRSDDLANWSLGAAMGRGADVVNDHLQVGASKAQVRLDRFIAERIGSYAHNRDLPAADATSGLSENLAWGEISIARCWNAANRAWDAGEAGAEKFLQELAWREFAYHLVYHAPHITETSWRPEWDSFPWCREADAPQVQVWKQARTGIELVDAGLREMYVTGRMHNRVRMVVASYLTKHLMTHWKIGMDWFADCLIDWDPAANAMGWQWVAGSGPDAAPYFRVFNPDTQAQNFDADRAYRHRWIAEGARNPATEALKYFQAIPKSWAMSPDAAYPAPIVTPAEGRQAALSAYQTRDF